MHTDARTRYLMTKDSPALCVPPVVVPCFVCGLTWVTVDPVSEFLAGGGSLLGFENTFVAPLEIRWLGLLSVKEGRQTELVEILARISAG